MSCPERHRFFESKPHWFLAIVSMVLLCSFAALLVAEPVYAQRRGGGSRFGGGSSGRYGGFKQQPNFRPPTRSSPGLRSPAPPRSAPLRMMPQQGIPGGSGGKWPLPKSINPNSPVASMRGFTGQTTKSGSPIVRDNSGKRYVIPQKGVSTSLRMTLLSGSHHSPPSSSHLDYKRLKEVAAKPLGARYPNEVSKTPGERSSPLMIGRFPEYIREGEMHGYRRFQVEESLWKQTEKSFIERGKSKSETKDQSMKRFNDYMWKRYNEPVLRHAIARKEPIYLADKLDKSRKGYNESFLKREVDFLESRGYTAFGDPKVQNGTVFVPSGK